MKYPTQLIFHPKIIPQHLTQLKGRKKRNNPNRDS